MVSSLVLALRDTHCSLIIRSSTSRARIALSRQEETSPRARASTQREGNMHPAAAGSTTGRVAPTTARGTAPSSEAHKRGVPASCKRSSPLSRGPGRPARLSFTLFNDKMMKAARYYGAKDIRIEEVPIEKPKPDEVQIKIGWTGICGTDIHEYEAGPILCPSTSTPHAITGEKLPITMGHEISGTVSDVGSEASEWKKGDRVVVEPVIACNSCYACNHDWNNACTSLGFVGLSGYQGGLASFLNVQTSRLHRLPSNVDLRQGAMVEPLAVAIHAVEAANFQKGQTALVCGSGPIGTFVTKVLVSLYGASQVIVSETSGSRRKMATAAGAHHVLNPKEVDVVAKVKELTGGNDKGVDASFDCAGVEATINTAIASLRTRGTCVNVAIWSDKPRIDMNTLLLGERTLKGVICYRHNHKPAIDALASGKINLSEFVTATIKLDDLIEKGFHELIHNNEQHVKILVNVTGQDPE